VTEAEKDLLDEIFFGRHGVGDLAIDQELVALKREVDPNVPTVTESEFARLVAKGESKVQSYIKAFGYNGTEHSMDVFQVYATRIMSRPRVGNLVQDIKERAYKLALEDVGTLVEQLNEDRKLARDLGQPSAAIAAVKVKASLLGLDQSTTNTTNIVVNMNDEQKSQILDRIGRRLRSPDVVDAEVVDVK
jgi:hypothetical protein